MKDQNKLYLIILIAFCSLALAFHFLILLKVIPYENTWGGKLKSDQEMYFFELLSIAINIFFLYALLQKANYVKPVFGVKTLSIIFWIFFGLFALNTIGNLFAETILEKSFSFITLLNAVLIWQINKPNRANI